MTKKDQPVGITSREAKEVRLSMPNVPRSISCQCLLDQSSVGCRYFLEFFYIIRKFETVF